MPNEKPTGEWAKQQKEGVKKQESEQKPAADMHDEGGAGEPATSDLEPEKDGGIAGP